jgi:hypothetical protein
MPKCHVPFDRSFGAIRYLLTGLAQRGYIVVATPYSLSFDYISVRARFLTITPLSVNTPLFHSHDRKA